MQRILVSLMAAALLSAGAAVAQDYTAERSSESALGTLTMPHDVRAEGGTVDITANVTLDLAEAREAGAQYLSLTAGNDNAPSGVQVTDLTLNANEQLPEPHWTDGAGTERQYKNYALSELPDELNGTVTFTVAYPEDAGSFDVETVILAMDSTFEAVSDGNSTYSLQSWTGVHPQGGAGTGLDDQNDTAFQDDAAAGNDTDDNLTDDPEEAGEEETPAVGVALTMFALLGLAVTLRRRG